MSKCLIYYLFTNHDLWITPFDIGIIHYQHELSKHAVKASGYLYNGFKVTIEPMSVFFSTLDSMYISILCYYLFL